MEKDHPEGDPNTRFWNELKSVSVPPTYLNPPHPHPQSPWHHLLLLSPFSIFLYYIVQSNLSGLERTLPPYAAVVIQLAVMDPEDSW